VNIKENCAKYVAFLRALYLLHQNHHWLTYGANAYGKHLLFERIYKSAADNVQEQPALIQEFLTKYSHTSEFIKYSLEAEQDFLTFSKEFYEAMSQEMSLGLDDMIMSIAGEHETNVYLLKQTAGDDMNKVSRLAKKFQIKLAQVTPAVGQDMQLQQQINSALTVYLANKSWGEVGFDNFHVLRGEGGKININCNILIPSNSPPFTNKVKYPQGLNQFKQEIMNLISEQIPDENAGVVQIVTVNGK
jgi:hypothetical protein